MSCEAPPSRRHSETRSSGEYLGAIGGRRESGQGVVWPLLVVADQSLCTDLPHLFQRLRDICIQDFVSIGRIKAFDERILFGLARFHVAEFDGALRAPGDEAISQQFWAVVKPIA